MKTFLAATGFALALGACAATGRNEAYFAAMESPPGRLCAVARDADFKGAGEDRLKSFVGLLTRREGQALGLQPGDVQLAIAVGTPKAGPVGVVAGEIGCSNGNGPPYRITLFRDALVGRQLQETYHTAAHEFAHIAQIRRDGLDCHGSDEDHIASYEQEAIDVADAIVPACTKAASAL